MAYGLEDYGSVLVFLTKKQQPYHRPLWSFTMDIVTCQFGRHSPTLSYLLLLTCLPSTSNKVLKKYHNDFVKSILNVNLKVTLNCLKCCAAHFGKELPNVSLSQGWHMRTEVVLGPHLYSEDTSGIKLTNETHWACLKATKIPFLSLHCVLLSWEIDVHVNMLFPVLTVEERGGNVSYTVWMFGRFDLGVIIHRSLYRQQRVGAAK